MLPTLSGWKRRDVDIVVVRCDDTKRYDGTKCAESKAVYIASTASNVEVGVLSYLALNYESKI